MIFDIDTVKKLQKGDGVHLTRWQNKIDGTKRITTDENCLVVGHTNFGELVTKSLRHKDKWSEYKTYGKTWHVEPIKNSYDNQEVINE